MGLGRSAGWVGCWRLVVDYIGNGSILLPMPLAPLILASCLLTSNQDLTRHVYPMAKEIRCPKVVTDVTDFPDAKAWADQAKRIVEVWFPRVTELLATDGRDPITGQPNGAPYKAPKQVRLIFKKELNVPAYASGDTITINGAWITAHPDDLGMVVHELTHVIQQYPDSPNKPGWLVEGVADYIRWWRYEPELHAGAGRTKVNTEKANYTDSYRTTAMWLAWCSRKYDMRLVPALDKAMRDSDDPMPLFLKLCGKNPKDLWQEFLADQK